MEADPTKSRGTKRKADLKDLEPEPRLPKRIKALDQDVINKIAAGEIIVAPMHALKELIENAVDAGATSIDVVVKDGGLKLLQITDNGHGINRDDLAILCERFTTSKLKVFEDLSSINTYGFRGEALASISHIAHLTVTTKTAESSCAWRAHYADGKLTPAKPGQNADPKPIAGRGGTQITVEDLFYNMPQRQKAFKSPSEEYAKILDVVGRYAVHCHTVAFACKKHGEAINSMVVPHNASVLDRIGQIHGKAVANELIDFSTSDARLGFKAAGWTSNANYHAKKTTIVLFINHRAVESSSLRTALLRTYSTFLPKGGHPFVYLTLDIEPKRVDVNVHPTKREVNFLNEDEIIQVICDAIRGQLSQIDTSRTFLTQSLLPGVQNNNASAAAKQAPVASSTKASSKPHESNLVRTDPSLRKITSMLPPPSLVRSNTSTAQEFQYSTMDRTHMHIRLTTIKELRAEVRDAMHGGLTELFASLTYVGLVDIVRRIVAIQSGVKLYLVDYGMLSNEYFYQVGLTDFANYGFIKFAQPLDMRALISFAVETEKRESDAEDNGHGVAWDRIADAVTTQLVEKREMLLDYFNLEISETGQLKSIPLLVKGYMPSLAKLPRFLMRLGPCVDWTQERACFHTLLQELASFYTPEQLPVIPLSSDQGADVPENPEIVARRLQMARMLEHVLFPAFRSRLVATKGLLSAVVEVANLKGLYRIFERC